MRVTITVDADYTASWEALARLTFTQDTDGRDDTAAMINAEEHTIVETLLAAINSLDDIKQMPYGQSYHRNTGRPEYGATLTTRITHKPPRHGLHLN